MNRFALPAAADEYSHCNNCGERKHYTALDDEGLCQECRPAKVEEEE
jgi:hypothetical protein